MPGIERSQEAKEDLVSIGYEVAVRMQSLDSANRVLDAIEETIQVLANHKQIGRARPDLHPDVRQFSV